MKKKYKDSIEYKVLLRIDKIRSNVVLRKELLDLGSYRQISRPINKIITAKKLVRIGAGIYAKAYVSTYTNVVLIKDGFEYACREALTKLGIQWEPDSATQKYNAGLTTQIPMWNAVQLKSRFRGKIGYNDRKLIIEKKINAK